MTIRIAEYIREDGSIPFKQWFDDLDPAAAAKVAAAQIRLGQGNMSSVKWFSGMGEYVIDWGPGYRIYRARDGEKLIVLFWRRDQAGAAARHRQGHGAACRIQSPQSEVEEETDPRGAASQEEEVINGTDA